MDIWQDIIFAFAFACNAKNFAIGFFFLSLFFYIVTAFGRTAKIFFKNLLSSATDEACDQDWTDFIGNTKKSFRKNCSLSYFLRDVLHVTCHVL